MRPRQRAACALLAGAVIWEAVSPDDELLSHAADDWIARWPLAARAAILITAFHLANVLDPSIDPFVAPQFASIRRVCRKGIRKGDDRQKVG